MKILIETDEANDTCYFGFDNRALERGGVTRSVRMDENITLDFTAEGRLAGLDLMNAPHILSSDFANVRLDSLLGVKEAAKLVGVNKPNFVRDHAARPGFPNPVAELATRRVWLRSQIESYIKSRKATTATRKASRQ